MGSGFSSAPSRAGMRSATPPPFQLKGGGEEVPVSIAPGLVGDVDLTGDPLQPQWVSLQGSMQRVNMQTIGPNKYRNSADGKEYVGTGMADEKGDPVVREYTGGGSMAVDNDDDDSGSLASFDSHDDPEFSGINTFSRTGLKKADLSWHVSNEANRYPQLSTANLNNHADTIWAASGKKPDKRLTIVTVQYLTSQGNYLRVCCANAPSMSPGARAAAEALGYVILNGIKSHGEANMIIYMYKHITDLRYAGHGCDKAACLMCETLMEENIDEDVDLGAKGRTGKHTGTYYHDQLAGLTSDQLDPMRDTIGKHYGSDGHLS